MKTFKLTPSRECVHILRYNTVLVENNIDALQKLSESNILITFLQEALNITTRQHTFFIETGTFFFQQVRMNETKHNVSHSGKCNLILKINI